jgi:hypothetical protein
MAGIAVARAAAASNDNGGGSGSDSDEEEDDPTADPTLRELAFSLAFESARGALALGLGSALGVSWAATRCVGCAVGG